MNTMYETLARAQCRERLAQAQQERRGHETALARKLALRAEKAAHQARLHLARAF